MTDINNSGEPSMLAPLAISLGSKTRWLMVMRHPAVAELVAICQLLEHLVFRFGRFAYANEQLLPLMAAAGRRRTVSGKSFLQEFQLRHALYINETPGGKAATLAAASGLVGEQARLATLNAVVMRFGDALCAVIPEADLPLLCDGSSEKLIDRLRCFHARQTT